MQVGGLEAQCLKLRHGLGIERWPRRKGCRIGSHGVGSGGQVPQARAPGAHVGGEHAVRLGHLGQHLPVFKNHVVFKQAQFSSLCHELLSHQFVTANGLRLIVARSENRLRAQCEG